MHAKKHTNHPSLDDLLDRKKDSKSLSHHRKCCPNCSEVMRLYLIVADGYDKANEQWRKKQKTKKNQIKKRWLKKRDVN